MSDSLLDFKFEISKLKSRVNELEKNRITPLIIQKGKWEITNGWDNPNELTIDQDRKRTLTKMVVFKKPFSNTPEIFLGLSYLDTDSTSNNIRIDASYSDVTREGFTLHVTAWRLSKIYGFRVEWLAYTI